MSASLTRRGDEPQVNSGKDEDYPLVARSFAVRHVSAVEKDPALVRPDRGLHLLTAAH